MRRMFLALLGAALPAIAWSQSPPLADALKSAPQARVAPPAAAPLRDASRPGGPAEPILSSQICDRNLNPDYTEALREPCRAYGPWVNSILEAHHEREEPEKLRMIQDGRVLELDFTTYADIRTGEGVKQFTFKAPITLVAEPRADNFPLTHATVYSIRYTLTGNAVSLEVITTPYGSNEFFSRTYAVTPERPLRLEMGGGDFIVVTPHLRSATPQDIAFACRNAGIGSC